MPFENRTPFFSIVNCATNRRQHQKPYPKFIYGLMVFLICGGTTFGQSAWNKAPYVQRNNLKSIIFGDSQFVAVGDSGTIVTSYDGETWIKRNSGTVFILHSITYGNGNFIATGAYGTILISSDGTTWTSKSIDTSFGLGSVCYGKGRFIATGGKQGVVNSFILNSSDGSTWVISEACPWVKDRPCLLVSIAYGDSQFIIVGGMSGRGAWSTILESSDGTTWKAESSSLEMGLSNISYCHDRFVAMGSAYFGDGPTAWVGTIATSSDGEKWTYLDLDHVDTSFHYVYDILPNSVTYGNGQFVALLSCPEDFDGTSFTYHIVTSSDCLNWTSKYAIVNSPLLNITYGNGKFVAVGSNGIILTSKADVSVFHPSYSKKHNEMKGRILNNNISIPLHDAVSIGRLKVDLFNLAGKKVYSVISRPDNGILNILDLKLPTCIYIVTIKNESNCLLTSTIINAK